MRFQSTTYYSLGKQTVNKKQTNQSTNHTKKRRSKQTTISKTILLSPTTVCKDWKSVKLIRRVGFPVNSPTLTWLPFGRRSPFLKPELHA